MTPDLLDELARLAERPVPWDELARPVPWDELERAMSWDVLDSG